jgi:thiamine transporter
MKKTNTKRLVESALLIALATVLSELPLVELPYGGSVTLASALPILLISYRHGLRYGVGAATAFGVVQQLFGLKYLSYFTTWQSVLTLILLDYVVAFAVLGLGGFLRPTKLPQNLSLVCGALTVCCLRYLCHVITGATIWAGLSIPTGAALAYSLAYNATYMIPETLVLCLAAYYLGSMLDFSRSALRRLPRVATASRLGDLLLAASGLLLTAALIFDTVMVFSRLQDPETGSFTLALLRTDTLADSFWMPVLIVTAACVLAAAVALTVRRLLLKKA